jgi:hypothetical protein
MLASGRSIGTLLRPAADSPSGPDAFGFEVEVPMGAELGAGIVTLSIAVMIERWLAGVR